MSQRVTFAILNPNLIPDLPDMLKPELVGMDANQAPDREDLCTKFSV